MSAVTAFLNSLRADLLDRRMLPVLRRCHCGSGGRGRLCGVRQCRERHDARRAGGTGRGAGHRGAEPRASRSARFPRARRARSRRSPAAVALQHAGPTRDPLAAPAVKPAAKKAAAATKVTGSSSPKAVTPAVDRAGEPPSRHAEEDEEGPEGRPLLRRRPGGYRRRRHRPAALWQPHEGDAAALGRGKPDRAGGRLGLDQGGAVQVHPADDPDGCREVHPEPDAVRSDRPASRVSSRTSNMRRRAVEPAVLYQLQLFSIIRGDASAASASARPGAERRGRGQIS